MTSTTPVATIATQDQRVDRNDAIDRNSPVWANAVHEVAHAVAAVAFGWKVYEITILGWIVPARVVDGEVKPPGTVQGRTIWQPVDHSGIPWRLAGIDDLVCHLIGVETQRVMSLDALPLPAPVTPGDVRGLDPELDQPLTDEQAAMVYARGLTASPDEAVALVAYARERARSMARQPRFQHLVTRVGEALLRRGGEMLGPTFADELKRADDEWQRAGGNLNELGR